MATFTFMVNQLIKEVYLQVIKINVQESILVMLLLLLLLARLINRQDEVSCGFSTRHIGHVRRMSVSGCSNRWFKPQHRYVVSLSKTLSPHYLCQLICEMSTSRKHPREWCLFSAMRFPVEIVHKNQRKSTIHYTHIILQ